MPSGFGNCCCTSSGRGYCTVTLNWGVPAYDAYTGPIVDANGCVTTKYLQEKVTYEWFANDPGTSYVTATSIVHESRYFGGGQLLEFSLSTSCEGTVWSDTLPDGTPGGVVTHYKNPSVYSGGGGTCNLPHTFDGLGRITSGSLCLYCNAGAPSIGFNVSGYDAQYPQRTSGGIVIDSATKKHQDYRSGARVTWELSDPITWDDVYGDARAILDLFDLTQQELPTPHLVSGSPLILAPACDPDLASGAGKSFLVNLTYADGTRATDNYGGRQIMIGNGQTCGRVAWVDGSYIHDFLFPCGTPSLRTCGLMAQANRQDCNTFYVFLRKSRAPVTSNRCLVLLPEKWLSTDYPPIHQCDALGGLGSPVGNPAPTCYRLHDVFPTVIVDMEPNQFGSIYLGNITGVSSGCTNPTPCC